MPLVCLCPPASVLPTCELAGGGCGVVGNGFMDHWPCNIFVFVVCFCHFVADVCACDVRPVHLSKLLYFCFALLFALLYVCLSFLFSIFFFNCFVLKLRVLTPSSKLLAQKIKCRCAAFMSPEGTRLQDHNQHSNTNTNTNSSNKQHTATQHSWQRRDIRVKRGHT